MALSLSERFSSSETEDGWDNKLRQVACAGLDGDAEPVGVRLVIDVDEVDLAEDEAGPLLLGACAERDELRIGDAHRAARVAVFVDLEHGGVGDARVGGVTLGLLRERDKPGPKSLISP